MNQNKLLGITITPQSKSSVLEKILKYIDHPTGFYHIISLNPENIVVAHKVDEFKKVIETAQMEIIDGIGVVLAGRLLGVSTAERVAGVDLMVELIERASDRRLRVLMIGGKEKLADQLAQCYLSKYPLAKFKGIQGIVDIKNPKKEEEDEIFSIVAVYKPQLVFVSFGSPDQELWIARHNRQFFNSVVMGVGGAFDYLSGTIVRSPVFIQKLGLEWFYRLVRQPWRWRRQVRLLEFIGLVIKQKIEKSA